MSVDVRISFGLSKFPIFEILKHFENYISKRIIKQVSPAVAELLVFNLCYVGGDFLRDFCL